MYQFELTSSTNFDSNLESFNLDKEKVVDTILDYIKSNFDAYDINKRTFFHCKYKGKDEKYILVGYVTKHEETCEIEATSIWDKGFSPENIEVKTQSIRIIK